MAESESDSTPKRASSAPKPKEPVHAAPLPEFVEDSSLLRQMVREWGFRVAVILFVLLAIGLALFLPKWWTSTPPGFTPLLKVSGLDRLEAWALRRTAQRHGEAGRIPEAVHAWRMAVHQDPGNPELSRSLVRLLANKAPLHPDYLRAGIYQSLWLLRLTKTNQADAFLVSEFLGRYELDDLILATLRRFEKQLQPSQLTLYLKALFKLERMVEFGEFWDRHKEDLAGDREMQLYHAAWLAGWGPPGMIRNGREALEAGIADAARRTLAHRLLLAVSFAIADLPRYESSFSHLKDNHADRIGDHVSYWRLLANSGRREEAIDLAKRFQTAPATADDCDRLARVYAELKLYDVAVAFLDPYLNTFTHRPDLWVREAELLIALGRWDEARALAVRIRQTDGVSQSLSGYAWYLEGLAELRDGRAEPAEAALANIPGAPITNPLLGWRTANALTRLGRPLIARQLLEKLETSFGGEAGYWFQLEMAAYEAREIDLMLRAAEKACQLAPDNTVFANNYAAALLILRERPGEAIRLTLRELERQPANPGARLNHVLALLQNERLDDADALLKTIDINRLNGLEAAVGNLARFELQMARGLRAEALATYGVIDKRFLMPPQLEWLETSHKTLVEEERRNPRRRP